jgi:TPR repeat protein
MATHRKSIPKLNQTRGIMEAECRRIDELLDQGDEKSLQEAISLLRLVAKSRDAWAQYMLGFLYQEGTGLRRSRKEAKKWYSLSAAHGFDSAQLNLGILLANDTNPDFKEALRLYRLAAQQGNVNAAYNLGLYYELGRGVRKNRQTSFKWYLLAAEGGEPDSQCVVGFCYFNGDGVTEDIEQAVRWYRRAAKNGSPSAMFNLSICYRDGDGVRASKRQEITWLLRAAEYGHEPSIQRLTELAMAGGTG